MKLKLLPTLLLCFTLLAACTPAGSLTPTGAGVTAVPTTAPTTAPTLTPTGHSPAELAAIQAVSKKYNLPADQIQIASSEAVTWPNGCLGVVIPGVMCTQNLVPGFRVLVTGGGKQYEIHTNQDGTSAIDAAQQLATLQFVVFTAAQTIQIVEPKIGLGPTFNPAFTGLLPAGGATAGTAYVLDFVSPSKAIAVDVNGAHDLSFIQNPTYGLALWRGGPGVQPRLAWGTQLTGPDQPSSLQVSNADGSSLETLLTLDAAATPPQQIVAEFWSADGQSLYFSKEPVGIGGYIPFSGATSLYQIDLASKQVKEIIPFTTSPMICLDAVSGDYRFEADHCTAKVITVRELATGKTTTIQPPADVTGFNLMGSARFSPDGSRLAFGLAAGDPSAEQGWVAVSDSTSGSSKRILTGQPGASYQVLGWLDDNTLLLQANFLTCSSTCTNELWTVGIDGSNPTKVADGSLLAVMDNQ
jgi:hypothetical protein